MMKQWKGDLSEDRDEGDDEEVAAVQGTSDPSLSSKDLNRSQKTFASSHDSSSNCSEDFKLKVRNWDYCINIFRK